MNTITLNDGTTVDGRCIESNGRLYVYLDGMTLVDGVLLFGDPQNVSHLTVVSFGHEYVYDGYTEIYAVNHEFGNCNLTMIKP